MLHPPSTQHFDQSLGSRHLPISTFFDNKLQRRSPENGYELIPDFYIVERTWIGQLRLHPRSMSARLARVLTTQKIRNQMRWMRTSLHSAYSHIYASSRFNVLHRPEMYLASRSGSDTPKVRGNFPCTRASCSSGGPAIQIHRLMRLLPRERVTDHQILHKTLQLGRDSPRAHGHRDAPPERRASCRMHAGRAPSLRA